MVNSTSDQSSSRLTCLLFTQEVLEDHEAFLLGEPILAPATRGELSIRAFIRKLIHLSVPYCVTRAALVPGRPVIISRTSSPCTCDTWRCFSLVSPIRILNALFTRNGGHSFSSSYSSTTTTWPLLSSVIKVSDLFIKIYNVSFRARVGFPNYALDWRVSRHIPPTDRERNSLRHFYWDCNFVWNDKERQTYILFVSLRWSSGNKTVPTVIS